MNIVHSTRFKLFILFITLSIIMVFTNQQNKSAFAQTNSPPDCSGGITVSDLQPVNGKYILQKGQTYQVQANGITDPGKDVAQSITNMTFRYKPTHASADNQCPSPDDESFLGRGIKTFTGSHFDLAYSYILNTDNLPSGEFYIFANPIDDEGLQCSGNPYGTADNNYCGVNVGCTNCYTTVEIVEIPTATTQPTKDPCPNAIFGNLSCDPDGLIDITDVGIFLEEYFGIPLNVQTSKANFSDDGSGIIDTGDYEILRQHYTPRPLPM